jgi:hypothetical protein
MKALEFESRLSEGANLKVPEDLAGQIPREEAVRVIVLLSEGAEDQDWHRLTSEQFLSGYSESDGIYDGV